MDHDRRETPELVSLEDRRIRRRVPALLRVEDYWESLKGSRLVPDRAEVDPRGLTGALEYAFVLERIAPGLARFRVAGMHLSDLMGMEVRGMPISAVFTPETRPELSRTLEAAFNEPARIRMQLRGEDGIGRPALTGEMTLLPLRSDGGEVNRALGAVTMDGGIGRQPRRLSITSINHKTLTGYAEGPALEHGAPSGFAEKPAGYTAPRKDPARHVEERRPSYLRLVHSREV